MMLDDKRQPRRRNLPAAIRVVALFIKIALVDATLAAKRLYLRFAHRKQGIERLEKSVRNSLWKIQCKLPPKTKAILPP